MPTQGSKILVVGPGAIGGITAACLARDGWDVCLLGRNPEHIAKIRAEGLHVSGVCGEFRFHVPAYASPADVPGPADIILLATKVTAFPDIVYTLKPFLKEGSSVVSLQNGICEDMIASIIGEPATIGCVVGWGATMHAPGQYEMTSEGDFVVGHLDGRTDERLLVVQTMLATVHPTRVSDNILGHLYAKLVINSCITTLGVVCGIKLGRLLAVKKVRSIFIGIVREALAVAEAMKVKVEPLAGLDFAKFLKGDGLASSLKRHALIRAIGLKYRRLKSSGLQSLERGERTEIEALNGYVWKKGQEWHVPTPLNARLTTLVHEIEAKQRAIGLANLDDPLFEDCR
jgi:2-dehydropantoate 2-reductase